MKNAFIFALLFLVAIQAFGTRNEAQAVIEDTTFHRADWQTCIVIPAGPIRRPDNYSAKPHGRRADSA